MNTKPIPLKKLLELRTRMIHEARSKNNTDPEDIAQTYVERLLKGYHASATVGQAYIDILRFSSGRKGFKSYEARRSMNQVASSEEQRTYMENQPEVQSISMEDQLNIRTILDTITNEKVRFILEYHLKGYTLKEIGKFLNISDSRVKQILDLEVERIRYKLDLYK